MIHYPAAKPKRIHIVFTKKIEKINVIQTFVNFPFLGLWCNILIIQNSKNGV